MLYDAQIIETGSRQSFRVITNWIPESVLRGNSKARRNVYAKAAMPIRNWAYNLAYNYHNDWPLHSPLVIYIGAGVQRIIDVDNLLRGYKQFVDGLEDGGVLFNDRDITTYVVCREKAHLSRSQIYSDIYITEASNVVGMNYILTKIKEVGENTL